MSTIKKIHQKLKNKEISCKELVTNYLQKISKSDLNAYVKVCDEQALETAEKVDKKIANDEQISILEGIPMALKDNMATKGIRTTSASKMLENYVPMYNATLLPSLKMLIFQLLVKPIWMMPPWAPQQKLLSLKKPKILMI